MNEPAFDLLGMLHTQYARGQRLSARSAWAFAAASADHRRPFFGVFVDRNPAYEPVVWAVDGAIDACWAMAEGQCDQERWHQLWLELSTWLPADPDHSWARLPAVELGAPLMAELIDAADVVWGERQIGEVVKEFVCSRLTVYDDFGRLHLGRFSGLLLPDEFAPLAREVAIIDSWLGLLETTPLDALDVGALRERSLEEANAQFESVRYLLDRWP